MVFVVGDFEQLQFAGAGDAVAIELAGGEAGVDRVADAVVAAIDPGEDTKRLAGDEHFAVADDRAARLVDDLGLDLVAVILVGMGSLGERGIDLDLQRAIGADGRFALGDDFGRRRWAPHPVEPRLHGRRSPNCRQPGYQA